MDPRSGSGNVRGGGPRGSRVWFAGLLALLALGYLLWGAALLEESCFPTVTGETARCLFDDAMISMRYADNLVKGHGLVWNPGERVEGYTNPLTTLLMAGSLAALPRSGAILGIQVLGLATALATGLVAVAVYRSLPGGARGRTGTALVLALTLAVYPLTYWSVMGMETGLVALLLSGAVAIGLGAPSRPASRWAGPALGGLLGALYLARPDTLVLAALVLGYVAPARRAIDRRTPWIATGIVAAVVLVHVAWRARYYGELFPNTAVLRLGQTPLAVRLRGGLGYLGPFFATAWPLIALAAASLVPKPDSARGLLLSLFAASVAWQIFVGGDPWPHWRLLTPAIPLLVVLAVDACDSLASLAARVLEKEVSLARTLAWYLNVILLASALVVFDWPFRGEVLLWWRPYQVRHSVRGVNAALALREVTTPSATVGTFFAGALPFFSERRAVDFLGRSDPYVARLAPDLSGAVAWGGMTSVPGHNKYDLEYSIVGKRPTYLEGWTWGRQDLRKWVEENYVEVEHRGVTLLLLRESPDVRWDLLGRDE